MRKLISIAMLLGCAGAQRETRSTPVLAPAAAPAQVSAAPAAPPAPEPQAEVPKPIPASSAFSDAVAAFEGGRLDEAKQGFESIPDSDPHRASARYDLGVIAERQGDVAAAERAYREALSSNPDHARALAALAQLLREQGKAADAVPLYESAVQRHPDELQLLNGLAAAQRSAGQREKAEATARRVLARSRDDAAAYRTLALCALDQGNARLAELYALTAHKRAGEDPSVANTLGLIYLKLDERPRALAELQRAIALDPSFAPAHLNLGLLALANRDYATAEKSFSRVLALHPGSREALRLRAWALDGLRAQDPHRGPDAGAAFEQVLALQPDDPEATCGAGLGYGADRTGYDRALPFLEKCLHLATTPQERQAAEARLRTIQAARAATGSGGSGQAEGGGSPEPAQ
ncbi:MAG TPA: tetratricopeptide repeat protein [Myxococcaceae bacterium]|jgi:tetratricopeptide (TPR) repeat protein